MKKQSRVRERLLAVQTLLEELTREVEAALADLHEEEKFAALRAVLNATAIQQQPIGYADVGQAIGVFSGSPAFSKLLERKVTEDAPGPLLCSLVVGANGSPSAGFITAAKQAGMTVNDPIQFTQQQQTDCYAAFDRTKKKKTP